MTYTISNIDSITTNVIVLNVRRDKDSKGALPGQSKLNLNQDQFKTWLNQNYIKFDPSGLNKNLLDPVITGKKITVQEALGSHSDLTNSTATSVLSLDGNVGSTPDLWPSTEKTTPFTPFHLHYTPTNDSFRIGYAIIKSPVVDWHSTRNTYVKETSNLRSSTSMKDNYGYSYESYELTYVVEGQSRIQSEVKEVFEQLAINPFVTVDGGPFGIYNQKGVIPYKEIAVRSYSVTTIPNQPGALRVTLCFDPYLWDYHKGISEDNRSDPFVSSETTFIANDSFSLSDTICWPLYKIWCSQANQSKYSPRLGSNGIDGNFTIIKPDIKATAQLQNKLISTYSTPNLDLSLAQDLASIVEGKYDKIVGSHVKLLHTSNSNTTQIVVKVDSADMWTAITGLTYDGQNWIGNWNSSVYGLAEWKVYSATLADQNAIHLTVDSQLDPNGGIVLGENVTTVNNKNTDPNIFTISGTLASTLTGWFTQRAHKLKDSLFSGSQLTTEVNKFVNSELASNTQEPWSRFAIVISNDTRTQHLISRVKGVKQTTSLPGNKITQFTNSVLSAAGNKVALNIKGAFGQDNDIIIESIAGVRSHSLSVTSTTFTPLPIHQFLGTEGSRITVQGRCFSERAKASLYNLKDEFDQAAIQNNDWKFSAEFNKTETQSGVDDENSPFLIIRNEIFQLLGVDFVIPNNLSVESVEGQPGVYSWSMQFMDFDPRAKLDEAVKFIPTYNQTKQNILPYTAPGWFDTTLASTTNVHPTVLKALDWFSLQGALANIEVYPDLYLPSHLDLQNWIGSLKRIAKNHLGDTVTQLTPQDYTIQAIIQPFIDLMPINNGVHDDGFSLKMVVNDSLWLENYDFTGFYVDPDFFYYYNSNDAFNNILDQVMVDHVGTANGLSGTSGNAAIRLTDLNGPIGTIIPPSHTSATESSMTSHTDVVNSNIGNVQTGKKDGSYLNTYKQIVNDSIQSGRANGWWVGDTSFIGNINDKNVIITTVDDAKTYSADAQIPIDADGQGKGIKNTGEKISDTAVTDPSSEFSASYSPFFSIKWRLDQMERYISDGKKSSTIVPFSRWAFGDNINTGVLNGLITNLTSAITDDINPLSAGNFVIPTGDFLDGFLGLINYDSWGLAAFFSDGSVSTEAGLFATNSNNSQYNITYTVPKGNVNKSITSIDDWSNFWRLLLNSNEGILATGVNHSILDANVVIRTIDESIFRRDGGDLQVSNGDNLPFLNKATYCERCYLINNNYVHYTPTTGLNWDESNNVSPHVATLLSYDLFLNFGHKYSIDPNLIAAYFITRSNYGKIISTRVDEGGFGNFSISQGFGTLGPTQTIELFCKTYNDNLTNFGLPVLALIATDLHLSGSSLTDNSKFDFVSAFTNIKGLSGQDVRTKLNYVFSNGLKNGPLYDTIFAEWIHISRVLGVISDASLKEDVFFNSRNPLLALDIGGNLGGRTIASSYSPSGGSILIPASRAIILNPILQKDNTSPEQNYSQGSHIREGLTPNSEDSVYGMLHDFRKYNKIGRLLQAYPTYCIVFCNEGFFFNDGNKKLWDTYYTRGNIRSIEVLRSRLEITDTATIVMSNVFHQLTRYTALEAYMSELSYEFKQRIGKLLQTPGDIFNILVSENIFKSPTPELINLFYRNYLNIFTISQGARMHIRMGYGSNPSLLPVIFNGTVAEVQASDDVAIIVGVGDGMELEKNSTHNLSRTQQGWAYTDGGILLGSGRAPSSLVIEALANVEFWNNIKSGITDNLFFVDRSSGIAHFGDLFFDGFAWYPTEMQINIYEPGLTALEQNVAPVKNVFETSAFWDWGNSKNYFSVSVQEPTAWKIIKVCANAVFDFVASPEPIMTQSTVFFGKWWWPMNYAYKESILDFVWNINSNAPKTNSTIPISSTSEVDSVEKAHVEHINKYLLTPDQQLSKDQLNEMLDFIRAKYEPNFGYSQNLANTISSISAGLIKSYSAPADTLAGFINSPFSGDTVNKVIAYSLQKILSPSSINTIGNITNILGTPANILTATSSQATTAAFSTAANYDIIKALINSGDIYTKGKGLITEMKKKLDQGITKSDFTQEVDTFKDVDFLVSHMYSKPFMQMYFCNSGINLLHNGLELDSSKVYTDAMGAYTYNGTFNTNEVVKTMVFSVDSSIMTADRKTMVVDTSIVNTALQRGWSGVSSAIARLPGNNPFIAGTPTTQGVHNGVVSALVESVKNMYDGWIIMNGTPTMKPHDIIAFNDTKTGLNGVVGVKEVIHKLDGETGLVTMFSPDCVSFPRTSFQGERMMQLAVIPALKKTAAIWGVRASLITLGHALKVFNAEGQAKEFLYNNYLYGEAQEYLKNNSSKISEAEEELKEYIEFQIEIEKEIEELKEAGADYSVRTKVLEEILKEQRALRSEIKDVENLQKEINSIESDLTLNKGVYESAKKIYSSASEWKTATQRDYYQFISKRIAKLRPLINKLDIGTVDIQASILVKQKQLNQLLSYKKSLDSLKEGQTLKVYVPANVNPKTVDTEISQLSQEIEELNNLKDRIKGSSLTEADFEILSKYSAFSIDDIKKLIQGEDLAEKISQGTIGPIIDLVPNVIEGLLAAPSAGVKMSKSSLNALKAAFRAGKDATQDAKGVAKLGAAAKVATEAIQASTADVTIAETGTKILDLWKTAGTSARLAGKTNLYSLLVQVALQALLSGVVDSTNCFLNAQKCVKVYPLFTGQTPLVAGLRGHEGAVVGDEPDWWSRLMTAFITGNESEIKKLGDPIGMSHYTTASAFLLGLVGVNAPSYGVSQGDQDFIKNVINNDISINKEN